MKLYKEMVTIRRLETAAANLYKEKAVRGFCHLCSGQEAVYSGIVSALRGQDTVITSYRAHGFTYAMGVSALGVLAEQLELCKLEVTLIPSWGSFLYNEKA